MEGIMPAVLALLCLANLLALGALALWLRQALGRLDKPDGAGEAALEIAALSAKTEALAQMQAQTMKDQLTALRQQQADQMMQTELKLENMRRSLGGSMAQLRQDNQNQLEQIRHTVDQRLQTALEKKLNDSFSIVSQRLEQVYRGLGEMQTLAAGVGDLKKVLSNVKTRGTLGELQLEAILEQILAPEQYEKNVHTKRGSAAVVEFAVKLPGDGDKPVWLPFDSKYPADAYQQLLDAYDAGDPQLVTQARKALRDRLRLFAKDIHEKYIDPPNTTDFGLMFLPIEGLYAEAVRMGLVEQLQQEYKVNIGGPSTTAALLNSLQLGFRTLAVQKRSAEVWKVLGSVKGEFGKFAAVLETTQKRLAQANEELDKLVGVRTRQIQRALRQAELAESPPGQAENLLQEETEWGEDHV